MTALSRDYYGRLKMALPDKAWRSLLPGELIELIEAYEVQRERFGAVNVVVRDANAQLAEARRRDVAERAEAISAGRKDPGQVHEPVVAEQVNDARSKLPVLGLLADQALTAVADWMASHAVELRQRFASGAVKETSEIGKLLDGIERSMVRRGRLRALRHWAIGTAAGQHAKLVSGEVDLPRVIDSARLAWGGSADDPEREDLSSAYSSGSQERAARSRAARERQAAAAVEVPEVASV